MPRINKKRRVSLEAGSPILENSVTIYPKTADHKGFFKQLERLLEDERLCDVTFRIQQQLFKAHRVILAATNSFLGVMMLTPLTDSSLPIIDISSDTDPKLFRLILDYIYGKTINVPMTSIYGLLALANCYSMPLLRENLADYLSSTMNINNCCSIFALADAHNCSELREQALTLIFEYFPAACMSESFTDLNEDQFKFIMSSDMISDCAEIQVFEAACRWLAYQSTQRQGPPSPMVSSSTSSSHVSDTQTLIQSIMSLVRFPLIDSYTLSNVVKPHQFMTGIEQKSLLLEAFEYHALTASGRETSVSERLKQRKKTCPFTTSLLLEGHTDSVSAMVCYGDYFITGSWDSTIKVWDRTRRTIRHVASSGFESPSSPIPTSTSSIHLSDLVIPLSRTQSPPADIRASNGENSDWHCARTLEAHAGAIRSLCVCNDKIVSCSDDGIINVWHPRTWTRERSMDGHDGAANAVIEILSLGLLDNIIPGQDINNHASMHRLVSAGDDGMIKVWNTNTWACEITLHNSIEPTNAAAQQDDAPLRVGVLSLEGWKSYLFSGGDDNVVRVWSTLSWTCIYLLRAHEDEVWALHVLNDGTLITGSVDATIRIWNIKYVDQVIALDDVEDIAINRSSVSISSRDEVHSPAHTYFPKITGWECVQVISSDGPVYSLSYLDTRLISAGASGRISIWHLVPQANSANNTSASSTTSSSNHMSWQLLKHFDTVEEGVWSLTVHKEHLISGGCEGTILYWH